MLREVLTTIYVMTLTLLTLVQIPNRLGRLARNASHLV